MPPPQQQNNTKKNQRKRRNNRNNNNHKKKNNAKKQQQPPQQPPKWALIDYFEEDIVQYHNDKDPDLHLEYGTVVDVPENYEQEELRDAISNSNNKGNSRNNNNSRKSRANNAGRRNASRNNNDSDSDSDDYSSLDSDYHVTTRSPLTRHEIRVVFLSGREMVIHKKFLRLIDRSFLHGDVVRRCKPAGNLGKDATTTQQQDSNSHNHTALRGTVRDINIHVDVEFIYSKKQPLKNVNAKHLKYLHLFSIGNYLVYDDNWLAKIEDCIFDVVLKFLDGSVAHIRCVDEELFHSSLAQTQDDSFPFFPAQVFLFDTPETQRLLRNARFLKGSYNPITQDRGLVINVIPAVLDLDFVSSRVAYPYPPQYVDLHKCAPFTYFKYTNWSIADVAVVSDKVSGLSAEELELDPAKLEHSSGGGEKHSPNKKENSTPEQESSPKDHPTPTNSEPRTYDIPQNSSNHFNQLTIHPPQKLLGRDTSADYLMTDYSKNVARITSTRTTVTVQWQDGTEETLPSVDVCSLKHVDEKDFFISDVVRTASPDESGKKYYGVVVRVDPLQKTCEVKWLSKEKRDTIEELPIFELEDYEDMEHSIGDVVTLVQREEDPNYKSHWAAEIIGMDLDDLNICYVDRQCGKKKMDDVVNAGTLVLDPIHSYDSDDEMDFDQFAMANELMEQFDAGVKVSEGDFYVEEASTNEEKKDDRRVMSQKKDDSCTTKQLTSAGTLPDSLKQLIPGGAPAPERFSMVPSFSDHKFANDAPNLKPSQKMIKTINKEWRALQKNLPSYITVLASEKSVFLMRAIIQGAENTPYYKTVHVFDIMLPQDYPQVPPKMHSHASRLKINPNLYEDNTICLSLLGTWSGQKQSEEWIPNQSSIYQLLLSISGLVLNASPFYNEANYDAMRGSEEAIENSRQYNEYAVLTTISHQTALFNRPPMHTGPIIQHFLQENRECIEKHLERLLASDKEALQLRNLSDSPSKGFLTSLKNRIKHYEKSMDKYQV